MFSCISAQFTRFKSNLRTVIGENFPDELREEAPVDGIETYYPKHSDEQVKLYLDYAGKHDLLVSSGSDSHSREKPPIKYPAKHSQKLLDRPGIKFV